MIYYKLEDVHELNVYKGSQSFSRKSKSWKSKSQKNKSCMSKSRFLGNTNSQISDFLFIIIVVMKFEKLNISVCFFPCVTLKTRTGTYGRGFIYGNKIIARFSRFCFIILIIRDLVSKDFQILIK